MLVRLRNEFGLIAAVLSRCRYLEMRKKSRNATRDEVLLGHPFREIRRRWIQVCDR
jgi:hypothetical protein